MSGPKLLIIQSGDENVARYLDASEPFHRAYAEQCHADYWRFDGVWKGSRHPAWNRLPMFLDAFTRGYERVLWMDSDTLVVKPEVDVFEQSIYSHEGRCVVGIGEEPGDEFTVPFVMRRTAGGAYWPADGADQYEQWNDGILLVNRSPLAASAIGELWSRRDAIPMPWHSPSMWELNWLLDYVKAHPAHVVQMDQRFNWQPFNGASPEQYAVIKAWHGIPHEQRWREFSAEVERIST